jgi:hypothetical protein
VTASSRVARVALAGVMAACGHPAHEPPRDPMLAMTSLPTPYALELTLTADPARAGRAALRVRSHGGEPVTVVLPDRPDQLEWFDPDARRLADPVLRVAWSAWRRGGAGLFEGSRPTAAQQGTRRVTLAPGDAHDAVIDLAGALGGGAAGWCARAWLINGGHPLASNVICWPAS